MLQFTHLMVSFVFMLYTTITHIRVATSIIPVMRPMWIIVRLSFAVEGFSENLVTPSGSVDIVVVSKEFGVVDEGCKDEVVEETRDEDFVIAEDVSSSLQSKNTCLHESIILLFSDCYTWNTNSFSYRYGKAIIFFVVYLFLSWMTQLQNNVYMSGIGP